MANLKIAGAVLLVAPALLASPIGEAMGKHLDDGELPGMVSIVVDARGKTTVDCRGFADVAAKSRMRPDTIFWLASNTKAIAAATLMTLVDDGKVNLDDPVAKYLPEFASAKVKTKDGTRPPARPITVRMTLSHMSGLPFFPGMPIDKRSISELARLAAATPLNADPGEKYAYSNWGIDVAMAVVEKVTGRPFASVMKERILDPLGMKDAVFVPSVEQAARIAKSYKLSEDKPPKEIPIGQFSFPYTDAAREPEGGGGLFGTADDLCRFFMMLAAGGTASDGRRILSAEAVAEMTRRQTPNRPKIASYGFGLSVAPNQVGHGGAYGTYAAFDPTTKTVRVLCISMSGSNARRKAFRSAWDNAVDDFLHRYRVVGPDVSRPIVKGFNGVISPDGTTLAFQRDAGTETWLGLYDLRTGATTWAEKGPGRAAFPCWTRAGDLLYAYGNELHTAFETWKGNLKEGYGIRLRGKDGTTRDLLVRGRWRDYSPCLSPDGRTLWYVTSRPPKGHPRANDFIGSCLARADVNRRDGGSPCGGEIVYYPGENWGCGVSQPVASPDGKLLAWAELTTFALPWRIMAARVDDLARSVSLTPPDMAAYAPNWSPDGTLLTFTGCRGDDPGWYVYVLDPALNRLRRVCLGENSSFAPDGKSLVYDRDGTVYLRPFGTADRPTAGDPLAKPADAFPWKEAEAILYAGTNFTRTAQVSLPAACAFGDEQTFFVRAKIDWDGDASRFQVMTFGRYAEHPLGFQLYFALNGRPHVGTRDANGNHVCLHTREPLAKAGVYEITGIRSKGRLWLCVGGAEPICAEFGDGLIALDHPQSMAIGSGLLPKSRLLSLEVGRGWPANVPVPRGGGLNDWRCLQ